MLYVDFEVIRLNGMQYSVLVLKKLRDKLRGRRSGSTQENANAAPNNDVNAPNNQNQEADPWAA